jgi:thioredoxin 1
MQIALIIIGILIVAFLVMLFVAKAKMKNVPLVPNHAKVLTLTDKNFQALTKNKLILVDFWASWCGPCRMMAPVLNELAAELSENKFVGKVDVEQYQSLAQKYKIRGIPTMVLFKNGQEVNRFVGVKSKEYLMKEMAKIG